MYNFYKFSTKVFCYNTTTRSSFIYKYSVVWNIVKIKFKIDDPASVTILKLDLETYLLTKQLHGDAENWIENNCNQI